uniref:protein-tyrosine-phosphatase n=1 Tax=Syphacia muris TaxID=451379 RepID=A0A0N5A7T4_9BILA
LFSGNRSSSKISEVIGTVLLLLLLSGIPATNTKYYVHHSINMLYDLYTLPHIIELLTSIFSLADPDSPRLDSVTSTSTEAILSYIPPEGTNLTFYIKYAPVDHLEQANVIETKATLVKLRNLRPATNFSLQIFSMQDNVLSLDSMETFFTTKEIENYNATYSIRTLPTGFTLPSTINQQASVDEWSTFASTLKPQSFNSFTKLSGSSAASLPDGETSDAEVSKLVTEAEQTDTDPSVALETEARFGTKQVKSTLAPVSSTNAPSIDSDVDISLLPEPSREIILSKEGNRIHVEWDLYEDTVCDGFRFKYTILSLSRPKTYSIETTAQDAIIKMLPEHKLEVSPENQCHIANVVGTKISITDEFYVSKVIINWDWPNYPHNFETNRLVVSYGKGKYEHEIEADSVGEVVIEKLDPNELYTFVVRNISRELDISSQAKTVRQITPPVITSTLYPGQISSTAININFGDSDPEHLFDKYELIFSGNSKNITKILEKNDEKSLTFTRLIPGKTYDFELYTIYKGIKSRAVIANVTTYPLKVDKLFPVVGKNYVVLYWDVQNFVNSNCRFRLSSETVELNNTNKYRFNNLEAETYYTFTITVIMGVGDAKAESESEMVTVGISQMKLYLLWFSSISTKDSRYFKFENDQNAFADTNGVIDNYAIIVTEDNKLEGDDYELKSWFEVRDEEHWPPYRASPSDYNPFKKQRKSKSVTFIVGAEDCEKRRLDEQYCNGMLRANVDYFIKIRSYSVSNIAMETDWVSVSGVASQTDESSESGRRLPCHMYLNGCPRKNAAASTYEQLSKSLFMSITTTITVTLLLLRLL